MRQLNIKIAFLIYLFCFTGIAISQNQYTRLQAGPKGIWIALGKQIPKNFCYVIERKDLGDWEEIHRCYAPQSKAEIQARIYDIINKNIGFNTTLSEAELNFLWKETQAGRADSLFAYYLNYPVLNALGMAYYDAGAVRGVEYYYRIKQVSGRSETSLILNPDRASIPGLKCRASFEHTGGKTTGNSISIDYKIINPESLHHVQIYRAYYLRSHYEKIDAEAVFYRKDNEMYLNILDASAEAKIPYSYRVLAIDAAGNSGDTSSPVSYYNLSGNELPPSVDRINTTSVEKEKAILVSWRLKNNRDIVSVEIYKSLLHDGRYFRVASASPTDTAYMDYDVEPVKTYFYTIVLNGSFENSMNSPRISGMLKANAENYLPVNNFEIVQNGNVVTLSWNRTEKDTRAYQIYRAENADGELLRRGKEIESDSSYIRCTDTLPVTAEDIVFAYAVKDINTSYNEGPFSNRLLAFTSGTLNLPIPVQLIVKLYGKNSAWLAWKNMATNENNVTGYEIMRRKIEIESGKEISEKWMRVLPKVINNYVDSTTEEGYSYFYAVKSIGLNNTRSSASLEQGIAFNKIKIPGVSNVEIYTADGKVEIQWTNPLGAKIKSIQIERAAKGEKPTLLISLPANTDHFSDTKVSKNKEYYYSLYLIMENGNESDVEGPVGVRVK